MTRFGWPLAAIGVLSLVAAGAIAQVDAPAKTAPAKTEPAKTEPAETEPAETGPAEPLYQQEPYDLITLNAANNSEVLKVEPLPRPVSKNPPPERKTRGPSLGRPGENLRVAMVGRREGRDVRGTHPGQGGRTRPGRQPRGSLRLLRVPPDEAPRLARAEAGRRRLPLPRGGPQPEGPAAFRRPGHAPVAPRTQSAVSQPPAGAGHDQ